MTTEKIILTEPTQSMTLAAGYAALKELEAGRRSVILMEDQMGCAAFEMGTPPDGIYLRFDSDKSGLCSLSVDTIILIRRAQLKNADYAIENMLLGPESKVIEVN